MDFVILNPEYAQYKRRHTVKQKKKLIRIGIKYGLIVTIVFFLRTFLLTPITVIGISMEPTYHDSDRLWQTSIIKPKRFDTVTFSSPRNGKRIVKRIIGLPGDTIHYINDQLFVNDLPLDEPYLAKVKQTMATDELLTDDFTLESLLTTHTTNVPKDKYFVLGDNRRAADDSRYFGFVDKKAISGVIYFRYYPFNKIGVQ